ncbi:L,D-transpeptidase family protein [Rhizobiaceae bacterium n13]|uniref:L,D-transpeptidase family protein n=1 Tax=Ferirhizobium litorale TaxID=2927786 RepID=A0AAE3U208_9HYPH|nr:L,D-transpeptidase family protein [Fererhizobium litorale]MDI7862577.1 L,D-transpeptidase family protein [Fererhizobium litorale]MDI7923589.1 L,D-transpeptidase family protein [Fererhizobium litorale]
MRIKDFAVISLMAVALAGCNDTLDSVDVSSVKNKVEQPLPDRIIAQMKAKGMERNAPIMIRILKEEGKLEVWKAKTNGRFDKIADYQICAWSGRLGPKVKEGDRQAPEGFYPLSPRHLNPNSKYYLAINTGFPNRYDQVHGRNGSNLMIHGACSSSGCYSMTDEQVLEIYAFARDAFKGGQQSVQLQALPFRMTAENMVRHRNSPHIEFWKMLKVGYDNFEVTRRPPEVNFCDKKYVFNQQVEGNGSFSAAAQCPPMSTPPQLQAALVAYNKAYDRDYQKALKKFEGMVWYEPSEAERKEVVKEQRKGRELAYAPTGTSLAAGKLMKLQEYEQKVNKRVAKPAASGDGVAGTAVASAPKPATNATIQPATTAAIEPGNATTGTQSERAAPVVSAVPTPNPNAPATQSAAIQPPPAKKPFWALFSRPEAPVSQVPAPAQAAAPVAASPAEQQKITAPTGPAAPAVAAPSAAQASVSPAPPTENAPAAPVATADASPKKPFWKFWSN